MPRGQESDFVCSDFRRHCQRYEDEVFPGVAEVSADSIETVAGCEGFDGLVAIGGCDKNMPGCMMGLARLNDVVFVYGGTIMPGGNHTDIISVFEAVVPVPRQYGPD